MDKSRMPVVGEFVKVIDEFGRPHDGLVTNCWNRTINVVYVTGASRTSAVSLSRGASH